MNLDVKKKTIAILVPFFGQWPKWIELFVDSIRRNETIDFFFFTDCNTTIFKGIKNISYEITSFEEYVDRYKKLLGDDIQIPNAYKICDLRPFFGLVHEDIIREHDFFGWTDIDLFFGDIRSFYTNQIISENDVLSTHRTRLSGHFALLRNIEKHRTIGYEIYRWKQSLQNPEFVGIDEHGLTNALQMTFFDKVAEKFKISSKNVVLNAIRKHKTKRHYFVEQYTTPFTPIPWIDGTLNSSQPEVWFYDKGVITNERDQGKQFMYLHLMNFKSSQWRADGTEAPWDKGFVYLVNDLNKKIVINSQGIKSVHS